MQVEFLKRFLIFCLPVFTLYVLFELFLFYYPNSFNKKAFHINKNKDVENIFLGSSHTQNAIISSVFDKKTANLAYGNQDYFLDNKLFFNYVDQLNSLERVFLEVDYHNLEDKNQADYFRLPWYNRYYGVKNLETNFISKFSIYSTQPGFFNNYMLSLISPFSYKYKIDENGFIVNDFPGPFKSMKYDETKISTSAPERLKDRHAEPSMEAYTFNKAKINEIITYCLKNDIEVYLISYPIYKTYRANYVKEKYTRRNTFLDSITKNPKIKYIDFETDSRFKVDDYKNDDHLNPTGAKKLSVLINDIVSKKYPTN